jgi:hypothetical protein
MSSTITQDGHPYSTFYLSESGYIYGKPLCYNRKADPGDRVYQKTLLKHNTIVNFVPGLIDSRDDMLSKLEEVLNVYNTEIENKLQGVTSEKEKEEILMEASTALNYKLVNENLDMRYLVFKRAIAEFAVSYQIIANKVLTGIFRNSSILGTGDDNKINNILEASVYLLKEDTDKSRRGFRLWMEKGTSISETINNTYGASALEGQIGKISNMMSELKILGSAAGYGYTNHNPNAAAESANSSTAEQQYAKISNISNDIMNATGGVKTIMPEIWQDSKFERSYNISFRFISPYGDKQSIVRHVIIPFLFLLTASTPRQMGPSGKVFPYIFQIDAPGWFCAPMAAITSMSFTKGGDGTYFSKDGLPLMIEGSISVVDLYSDLTIPKTYGEFATNMGTASFLHNLAGLPIYHSMDATLMSKVTNKITDTLSRIYGNVTYTEEEINAVSLFLGFTKSE